mmetsp:Transcript_19301/g.22985  ORF Transcript_19301/g.22985 Transcript_19301/m.22985 type:complete len:664 (+) Transcript_19301:76-2067(+)
MMADEDQHLKHSCLPIWFIWQFVWPIPSLLLGIATGSLFGLLITAIVFLLTLVRTPMHICKMLYVTATTDKCFPGYLSMFMRISVFLLVPLPHMLWLLFVTVFSGTIGMLYYIGKATQIIYNHEYSKTMKQAESNAKLDPKSHLGKYYKRCQEFMENDENSYPTIYFLKACTASVPGTIIGILPFIPFSVAMVGISLLRLPINLYKTMKISLVTKALKLDMKIIALITLPFVHVIFPLVVFFIAICRSLFYFTYRTSRNIYKGNNPFKKWGWFQVSISDYYKAHQNFIAERCNAYDHPSGIPWGWQGQRYGVPVKKILLFQWNFIFCCFLVIYSIPITFVGGSFIYIIRILPTIFWYLKEITKTYCKKTCIIMMGTWPLYVAGMIITPPLVVIIFTLIFVGMILVMPFIYPPRKFIYEGYRSGLSGPLRILEMLDGIGLFIVQGSGWKVCPCLDEGMRPERRRETNPESVNEKSSDQYWDQFTSQCIKTTQELIEAKWITLEDVQSMDPAVITSIPAIAVLDILADSALEKGLGNEDIKWSINDTICKRKDRPMGNAILDFFWPLIYDIKKTILSNNQLLADRTNVRVIMAMICDNGKDCATELKQFLDCNETLTSAKINILLRTKLINFMFEMIRVKPYLDRMGKIYEHEYVKDAEKDLLTV